MHILQSIDNDFRTLYIDISWDDANEKVMPSIFHILKPEDVYTWESNSYQIVSHV